MLNMLSKTEAGRSVGDEGFLLKEFSPSVFRINEQRALPGPKNVLRIYDYFRPELIHTTSKTERIEGLETRIWSYQAQIEGQMSTNAQFFRLN